jgi:hypothetical protein
MSRGTKNYFRHHTGAFEDPKIQKAIDLLGYEGYAYYFIILELCVKQCENEYKNPITIHQQTLRIVLRKSQQSCHKVVTKLQESGLFVVTFTKSCYEFSIPNLSKYMGRYESKLSLNVPNKRKEKENKIKENKIKENSIAPNAADVVDSMPVRSGILQKVSDKTYNLWLKIYPNDYIETEAVKMETWLSINEHKAPKKNWGNFISNWLSRGWDQHRKNLPSAITKGKETAQQRQDRILNYEYPEI